jgi:hypothetical protein
VPAGTIVLRVSKEGYLQSEHTFTLTANTNVLLMLSPAASPPPSPTGVVKVGSGNGQGPAFVEGVNAGIASVSGRYFGVSTAMFQVQVIR